MSTTISRYNALRRELLRVELDLAQARRAYFVDGVSCPQDVRATLDERRARVRLELHDLKPLVEEEARASRTAKGNVFLTKLIAGCEAAGRHDLVRAANADAAAWLEQQGLTAAYTGKA